jgi:hypothetical protein
LFLTVVGSVLGGPIGAAIGASIGQVVDHAVLFKPKGREGPRLADLRIQTSRYGDQIPQLFGAMRVAGTVIWATDLDRASLHLGRRQGQAQDDDLHLFDEFCGGALCTADRQHRADLGGRQSAAGERGGFQIADW